MGMPNGLWREGDRTRTCLAKAEGLKVQASCRKYGEWRQPRLQRLSVKTVPEKSQGLWVRVRARTRGAKEAQGPRNPQGGVPEASTRPQEEVVGY